MNLLPIDETKSKRKKEIDERETRGRGHEGKRKKENVKKENVKIINQEADKERKKREKGASPSLLTSRALRIPSNHLNYTPAMPQNPT